MKYKTIIGAALAVLVPALALGQATHSVGTANTTLGILKLFGSTSGDVSIKPAAVAGTSTIFQLPANNGTNTYLLQTDGSGVTSWVAAPGTGTVTQVICGGGLTGGTITTTGTCAVAPITFATGTTHNLVAPSEIWECTGACTVTPPTPAAGYQFCVRNANAATGVITLAGVASVLYEKTDWSAYGTANTAATSGGALGDKICIVGKDSTHYDVFSFNGTWSVP